MLMREFVCLSLTASLCRHGFWPHFQGGSKTLHKCVTASFLLQMITKTIPINFAVRHGDLLAMLIYNIQLLHPFLLRLKWTSFWVFASLTLMSEWRPVLMMWWRLVRMTMTSYQRSHKTVLGLGAWSVCRRWPYPWVNSPSSLATSGVIFAPTKADTMSSPGTVYTLIKYVWWLTKLVRGVHPQKNLYRRSYNHKKLYRQSQQYIHPPNRLAEEKLCRQSGHWEKLYRQS
jgi:hypothetical protein